MSEGKEDKEGWGVWPCARGGRGRGRTTARLSPTAESGVRLLLRLLLQVRLCETC